MNHASIGSDHGLASIQRQAIISTNAGLLSIGPVGTIFSEILSKIQNFSFMKIYENIVCEMAAILSRGDIMWSRKHTKIKFWVKEIKVL